MSIWKQFIAALARFALVGIFSALVSRKIVSQELADAVLETTVGWIALAVLALIPIVWTYLNKRFQLDLVWEALHADSSTPLVSLIKQVRRKNKTALPV